MVERADLPEDCLAPPAAPAVIAAGPCAAVPRGEILERRLGGDPAFRFHAYVPHSAAAGAAVLATVHGISRNARQHLRMMAPLAERYGVVMLAPRFARARFPGYQRLLPDAAGLRPDALLWRAVRSLAAEVGADAARLHLFGYSGGAQFVHRAVMRRPERVRGYALGAAGWYTQPDEALRYPYGLRRNRRLALGGFDPDAFLRVPGVVLVGERDNRAGSALRRSERLDAAQGPTRLERARRWVAAMNAAALARDLEPPLAFELLARSPHSFARSMRRGDMGTRAFAHLFGPTPA